MKSLNKQTSAQAEARSALRIVKSIDDPPAYRKYIGHESRYAIPTQDGLRMIRLSDILFVQADSNYSIVHTQQGKRFVVSKPLKHFVERFADIDFLRSHQSYLVNCSHIETLSTGISQELTMSGGSRIPVSRRLGSTVKNYLINQFSI